jgi:hypothetical protein
MATRDKELDAISAVIKVLTPLDEVVRGRVLEYVLRRLDMASVSAPAVVRDLEMPAALPSSGPSRFPVMDIRSLTVEKQPKSANEMAAVVAYYLAEKAPEEQRVDTINVDAVRRYFKQAQFPLPRVLKNVLTNAFAAGYFDNVARGEYRLNPVGYNLVVHGLPRGGSAGSASGAQKRKTKTRPKTKGKRK